jgi:hypothetical protein
MYKLINLNGKLVCIQKQEGDVLLSIPFDPANVDFQEYQKWVAEGNTPLPADE